LVGQAGAPPIKKNETVLSVAFLVIPVIGFAVFAPNHDFELGIEVSVNAVLLAVGQAHVEEFIDPYDEGVDVGSIVAFALTGYIRCGWVVLILLLETYEE
jgi:hypothetical protein